MPLLAELPDPSAYQSLGWVLAVLFGIATGALVIKQLFHRDPPLHREYVDRVSYDRDREETRAQLTAMEQASKFSRAAIYEKLNEQSLQLAQTSEKSDLTYAQVQNLDAKMDQVLQRLPRR
jgi:DNA-binding transcriptional regulator YbjK